MRTFKLTNKDDGLTCYEWIAESPKKQMIIIHGLAEHAQRYNDFANYLNKNGINVFSMDLRGHGQTTPDGLGVFSKSAGWKTVIDDISMLYSYVKDLHPELKILLFGHSMGSIFARAVLQRSDDIYEKCILSGVTVSKPVLRDVAPFLSALFPKNKPAKVLDDLTFGDYSKAFKPNRTKFDWLSRDEKQVNKYVEDDKCGFVASGSMFNDVSRMLLYTLKAKHIKAMPKQTPIYIISGQNDPCGSFGYDAEYLSKSYIKEGLDVKFKIYEGARHELINETNNKEVYKDIVDTSLQ